MLPDFYVRFRHCTCSCELLGIHSSENALSSWRVISSSEIELKNSSSVVFPSFVLGLLKVVVMKLSSGPLPVYCTSFGPFFLLATCLVGSCRASFVGRGRLATSYLAGNLVSSSILAGRA